MSLSREEISIVRLNEICFGYLWNFPLKWNSPSYTKPILFKSLLHCSVILLVTILGFLDLLSFSYISWFDPNQSQLVKIAMATDLSLVIPVVLLSQLFINRNMVLFIGNFISLAECISKGKQVLLI